jgi:hypothetical protein
MCGVSLGYETRQCTSERWLRCDFGDDHAELYFDNDRRHAAILSNGSWHCNGKDGYVESRFGQHQLLGCLHRSSERWDRHGYGDEQCGFEQVCFGGGHRDCVDAGTNTNASTGSTSTEPVFECIVQRLELPSVSRS